MQKVPRLSPAEFARQLQKRREKPTLEDQLQKRREMEARLLAKAKQWYSEAKALTEGRSEKTDIILLQVCCQLLGYKSHINIENKVSSKDIKVVKDISTKADTSLKVSKGKAWQLKPGYFF